MRGKRKSVLIQLKTLSKEPAFEFRQERMSTSGSQEYRVEGWVSSIGRK